MSTFHKDFVNVDFKRSGSHFGVQISFEYGIDSFDLLRTIIKSCGGSWNKELMKQVVTGPFAFYCIDLIQSTGEVELRFSDFFRYYLKNEMKRLERNIVESRAKKPTKKFEIPANPGKTYFDFQKASVEFFESRGRSILLADDMGVGKTISSIAIANHCGFKKILVICPDSAKDKVWRESLEGWYVGSPKIQVLYSGKEIKPDSDIVIMNYELVSKHEKTLIKSKFQYLIVDEAHMLKTTSSKRTKAIKTISGKIKAKIFLTGTPILNRPIELYSLLRIIAGSAFGTKSAYAFRYCDAKLVSLEPKGSPNWAGQDAYDKGDDGDKDKKEKVFLDDKGESNLNELNFKLRSMVMMRREKADVINEFPNVARHVFQIDADYARIIDEQYRTEKKRYNQELSAIKKNKTAFFDYRSYTKAIKEVQKYHFDQIAVIRKELGISKVPDVAKFVQALLDRGKKKIILFMHHREAIESLHAQFPKNSVVLYGGMGSKEKAKVVDAFEKDDNVNIFIGSIQASGVAYTLNVAHTVVFGELDWTPSMIDQCEARCIRLGQKNDVTVFYLIVNNSLDQNMLDKIHKKGKMIKVVML